MHTPKPISADLMKLAEEAFLSVPKSFTIRQGKVSGEEQFAQRLSRVIHAVRKHDLQQGGA